MDAMSKGLLKCALDDVWSAIDIALSDEFRDVRQRLAEAKPAPGDADIIRRAAIAIENKLLTAAALVAECAEKTK